MANALVISKQTGGYFAFNLSIDGAPQEEVRSIQNDLLTVGNTLHFKTSNGANIIKQQNITPAELTIIASGTFTFATVTQVWDKLIEVGFFDWLGTGGGAGVDRFDELLDTFQYFGKDGYVCVVNESQQKLEAVPFYNYRKFTDLEDSPSFLVPNKMVVVNPAGTSLILQDQPPTPDTYLNSVGYFDYNDSITHTTPLAFVTNTPKKLTNDTLGVNTNTSENPYGVSYVWNGTTNQFDFSQLSIGDTLDIRVQVQVTTTTANQKFKISAKLGIGSVAQFENTILSSQVKTAGLEEISFVAPFYIGSSYIRDFPAELYITSDAGGTVIVDGWYVRILRKNINIITVESSVPDATTLVKGIVRLGGDLAGTADNPTVPALATKIANTRLINTTAPLSGGGDLSVDRTISIPQANTSTNGYLSGGDWTTFNNKQGAISLTTTGSSGASTFITNTLNIPNYTLAGLGGQPLNSNLTSVSSLSYVSPAFVKMTGLNTFTLDTNTYALDSNVLHNTTDESFTGIKSSTNTGATQINGIALTNNGTVGSYSYSATITSSGRGYRAFNSGTADSFYSDITGGGAGFTSNGTTASNGFLFVGRNDGVNTFTVNKTGDIIANSFTKLGATASSALLAGGTVLENPISGTGTGTTNALSKFTGANALGNSGIIDNGTTVYFSSSNVKITGADATTRFSVGNSSSTAYINFYGETHATIPNDIILTTNSAGRVRFFTTATERAAILANGNFLIGTTTDSGNKLRVNGTVRLDNLAGTGTRTVVADASGNLSASTTSNPAYKAYVAMLNQSGTSEPTSVVMENTLGGTVVWTRSSQGVYKATLTGVFTLNKTAVFITNGTSNITITAGFRSTVDEVAISTENYSGGGVDSKLQNATIEIRVYN